MADDHDRFIDLYENEPGHWEHRPPPAFPNPRAPPDPPQPEWAREMHANAAGCMPVLWFVVIIVAAAALLMAIGG